MPSTLVDAGPLIALFEPSDNWHVFAKAFVRGNTSQLITNYPVLAEVAHVLAPRNLRECLTWANDALSIDAQTTDDLGRIIEILGKYEDLPADFADASLVALSERLGVDRIATFDRDFDIYRTKSRKRLVNVLETK